MYIIFALLAFSALILVHELGHFIVAKLNGIYVEEFAIGMGPKLFGVKVGETEYNLRILPFGGFVKMLGEEDESDDSRSLNAKTPIQRILVMGAGAFMNYVLLKNQDVAFPVLHGMYGEDGTIQGLFELAKLPYVGCRVMGSSVAMDKIYTKKILDTVGVPQVKSVYVKKRYDEKLVVVTNTFDEIEEIEDYIVRELGMPCFIKASRQVDVSHFP